MHLDQGSLQSSSVTWAGRCNELPWYCPCGSSAASAHVVADYHLGQRCVDQAEPHQAVNDGVVGDCDVCERRLQWHLRGQQQPQRTAKLSAYCRIQQCAFRPICHDGSNMVGDLASPLLFQNPMLAPRLPGWMQRVAALKGLQEPRAPMTKHTPGFRNWVAQFPSSASQPEGLLMLWCVQCEPFTAYFLIPAAVNRCIKCLLCVARLLHHQPTCPLGTWPTND